MKYRFLLSLALLGLLSLSASAETTVKILHLQKLPKVLAIWQEAAQQYEKAHPGVNVKFDYLENEAFKAKLPTLLQSKDRPNLFWSWGGGVMIEQINAGVCQDITNAISQGGFKDTFYPAGVQNFTYQGKTYGLPNDVAPIVFWYNKDLVQKAGVDPTKIKYWDDFIEAVKKCQAAGITPIAAGGKDKWPLHFYPAMLMMRILGKEGMQGAYEDKNGGFASPDVVKAFQLYQELTALNPFQKGYLANTYGESAGTFHDGKTAFHLMGIWDLTEGRSDSTDQKGLPDEKLGWIFFPEVKDGKGHANDIFASLDGWLVAKGSPKETVDFMRVFLGKDIQGKIAAEGLDIPMVKGTADFIKEDFFKQIAQETANSQWIQIAMDQLLGPDTGRVFNDACADIAAGNIKAEQAAKTIEKSWQQNKGDF
ncbi:MAG: carbohydrate ABC transporter substrate-binding protein [Verrucomicrobia bacterium]|nr:carbohydrate ABC transporter substrate-binding protein [Verrucomicrobiota bacterium]